MIVSAISREMVTVDVNPHTALSALYDDFMESLELSPSKEHGLLKTFSLDKTIQGTFWICKSTGSNQYGGRVQNTEKLRKATDREIMIHDALINLLSCYTGKDST